jgi:hypothetical protein
LPEPRTIRIGITDRGKVVACDGVLIGVRCLRARELWTARSRLVLYDDSQWPGHTVWEGEPERDATGVMFEGAAAFARLVVHMISSGGAWELTVA